MKTKRVLIALLALAFSSLSLISQTKADYLKVFTGAETTALVPFEGNDGPSIKVDMKMATTLKLPGDYGRTMNFSLFPWYGGGMGYSMNLNFNWNGMYFRRHSDTGGWEPWQQIIMENRNGNVGIGTSSPSYKLDVKGSMRTNEDMYISGKVGIGTTSPSYKLEITGGDVRARANMYVTGNVGIGTSSPKYKLDVIGTIRAREVRVDTNGADFVFDTDYQLPTLNEVKAHIEDKKHLPGIPSAAEMQENGVGISELSTKLLQKVEELTLYVIQQNEIIEKLNNKISDLEKINK